MSELQTLENNAICIITGLGACQVKDESHDGDLSSLTSTKEECILRAYDRLLELELESSLLRAQDIVRDGKALDTKSGILVPMLTESQSAIRRRLDPGGPNQDRRT